MALHPFVKAMMVDQSKLKNVDAFYNGNSLLGNDWALFYMLIASGGIGKSYWVMNHVLNAKYANPDKVRVYWTRLTDTACGRLLARNADKLIDADLYRKYGKDLKTSGSVVYYGQYVERTAPKSGKIIKEYKKEGELLQVHPLSTFFNNKGEALFDNGFEGDYYIVLDEMNREAGEANRFDIVEAFTNQLENFTRTYKGRIRVIMIGNNMSEVSDILAAFNFIPKKFGRFKLKRRKAIIDVIKPTDKFLKMREGSAGNLLNPNAGRYRDIFEPDERFVVDRHLIRTKKPSAILCFSKQKDKWFCLNEGQLISRYKGEKKPEYGMIQYLGKKYNKEFNLAIEDAFNAEALKYDSHATYIQFTRCMALRKK